MSSFADPAKPSRRVAFVINSLAGGGAERVLSILLDQFSRRPDAFDNAEIHLILLDRIDEKYQIPKSVTVHRLDSAGAQIRSVRILARAFADIRPDISISFLTRANGANILAAKWTGHHCVISERVNTTSHLGQGLRAWINRLFVRILYPHAELIVVNSQGTCDDLSSHYGVQRHKIEVIPNPFDLEAIRASALRPPDIEIAPPYAIAVGRLTRNKNFSMLIRAFAEAEIPDDLIILGEGDEHETLLREARAAGIANRLHLPGFVGNPYPLIKGARFFVSASSSEGFPNAMAEAMVLGKPVVSTDCPSGPSEILEGSAPAGTGVCQARNGLLVPVGDQAALASAMRQICDPVTAQRYGAAAARRMESYRADAIAAQYESVIRSVGKWVG
jgi:glycosyltransferase involved in cell wall biosynthesis